MEEEDIMPLCKAKELHSTEKLKYANFGASLRGPGIPGEMQNVKGDLKTLNMEDTTSLKVEDAPETSEM